MKQLEYSLVGIDLEKETGVAVKRYYWLSKVNGFDKKEDDDCENKQQRMTSQ